MRRGVITLFLLVVGISSGIQAQELNSLVYPHKNKRDYNKKITDIQEMSFTHKLLSTPLYKNVKSRLAKAKQFPFHFKPAEKGDIFSFYVRNILQTETWNKVQAECIYVSDKLAIWIRQEDKQLFTGPLSISDLIDRLSNLLEQQTPDLSVDPTSGIIGIDDKYFGHPPNIDGDGRLDILLLDINDQFEETGSYVAGFFDPVNLTDDPHSNHRDMIYVDLYPSVIYQGEMKTNQAAATIAHEYQHLVHANYEGETTQSVFINEGLSELAEILCGFAPRKPDAYFQAPGRSLLSWNYSNPLPDYARASLFMEYLFEQLGFQNIKKLVQTKETGVQALQEVISNTSPLTLSQLFMNWGKAMILNDRSINPALGYKDPLRRDIRFSTGPVYNQLPEAGNLTMPHLVHLPVAFPLTDELNLHSNNVDPHIAITGEATYPDGTRRYIGSSQSGNAHFVTANKPYGSVLTLISNQELSSATSDSVETAYNFLATGRKSGETVTMAYDDGIADAFSGHASYYLLDGDKEAYAVAFQADDPAWLYALNIKGIFLSELEGSGFPPEEPRDITIQLFGFQDGAPTQPLTPPITHRFRRPLGNLRFETVSLVDFYPDLKDLQGRFCVVIRNDGDDANYFAVGLDHGHTNNTWFKGTNGWISLSDRTIGEAPLHNWNAMVRAEIVAQDHQISSRIAYPNFDYDYQGVTLSISPLFQADTTRSSCFAELPTGRIVEGVFEHNERGPDLTYRFPVEVGGTYTFYNRTVSENGREINKDIWRWKVPDSGGFELSQNYPNPFNPETTVPFELLEAGSVQLSVYDILGRNVLTLPARNFRAGPQRMRVDLSGQASGMYLVRMSVTRPDGRGTASQWQKVMLIK